MILFVKIVLKTNLELKLLKITFSNTNKVKISEIVSATSFVKIREIRVENKFRIKTFKNNF